MRHVLENQKADEEHVNMYIYIHTVSIYYSKRLLILNPIKIIFTIISLVE